MSIMQVDGSITHTYGNVACAVMNYIKSYFTPKTEDGEEFFRTSHISTKLSSRQLNVYQAKAEFWKNKKPMIIMRPRIDLDDSSKWFYGNAMMSRLTNSRTEACFDCTVPLLENKEFGTMIRFGWNRLTVTFDFVLIFETYNQQINIAHALKNRLVPNCPYPFHTPLESYIPNTVIYNMADHLGIQRADIREILFYLNTYAGSPVTHKLKNSSGNDEFFMLYETNIDLITSEITVDDGEGTGMIQDTFTVSFTVTAEFNAVGSWFLFLMNRNPEFLVAPTGTDIGKEGTMIPIMSIPLKYDLKLTPGWEIFAAPCYMVDAEKDDVTDLSNEVSLQVANLILTSINSEMNPIGTLIRFECFLNTYQLQMGKDYDISIEKDNSSDIGIRVKIITHICRKKATYRVFILVNNFAVNTVAAEVTGFTDER